MSTLELWTRRESEDGKTPRRQRRVDRRLVRGRILAGLLIAASTAAPALAENHYDRKNTHGNQVIVHAAPADAVHLAARHGLEIAGELRADGVYAVLLEAPASLTAAQVEELLRGDPRVLAMSRAELAALPTTLLIEPAQEDVAVDAAKTEDFTTACLARGFSGRLWSGYADQEAARAIRLHQGHAANGDCGSAVVALLDTGVDPGHALLAGALVPGYDFLLGTAGIPSEWTGLDSSVAAILESSVAAILEESQTAVLKGHGQVELVDAVGPILSSSVAAILEQRPALKYFGHGTMVAGLVRLAAPSAKIMPFRVFDASGQAHVFDVVRAIYYAVDDGADVISMSFSMESDSPELRRAVKYARDRGVVCVAAAGNQGQRSLVYPAALPDVIAVAALAGDDLAEFTNYGSNLVDLAAPGSGVVSAYPGGLYGAGWGTSFSAPLVAGTAALLIHRHPVRDTAAVQSMERALRLGSTRIDALVNAIGSGRLDVLGTVRQKR